MTDIRLVDLDLFKRYSLAIRQETAPAEEILAVLEATRRQVVAAAGGDFAVSAPAEQVEPEVAPPPAEQPEKQPEKSENGVPSEWAPDAPPARRRRRTTGPSPGAGR